MNTKFFVLGAAMATAFVACKNRSYNDSKTANASGESIFGKIIKENRANGRRGGINTVTKKPCAYLVAKDGDFASSKLELRVDFSSNNEPQFGIRSNFSKVPFQNKLVAKDSGCSGPWCLMMPGTPLANTRYEIEYTNKFQIETISYFSNDKLEEQCLFSATNFEYEKVLRANEARKLVVGKNEKGAACSMIVRNDTTFGTDDMDLYVNYYSAEEPPFAGGFGNAGQFVRPPNAPNKLVAVDNGRYPISVILNGGPLPETRAELEHDAALQIIKVRSFQDNKLVAECSIQ